MSYVPILVFCVTELLLVMRVCALYNGKFVIWSLRGLLAGAVVGGTVAQALYERQLYIVLYYEFLPGCWGASTYSNLIPGWPMWAVFLSIEGVFMLLTAYKIFSYRKRMHQTVAMLARDSIVYFIVIFACLTMDILTSADDNIPFGVTTPTQCISSIMAGRMMMNIRGLNMDDPEHTVHLKPLEFATRTNAGSEIEERMGGEA